MNATSYRLQFVVYLALGLLTVTGSGLAQAPPAPPPPFLPMGPVPAAIPAAKSIFISNCGADSGLFPHPFTGDENRAYTELYAQLKATGNYEMAADPSTADLVLEVRLRAPYGPTNGNKALGAADPLPSFRLVIYDRKSHYVLWSITAAIDVAAKQKTHDRNFDDALNQVLLEFEAIGGKLPPAKP